MPSWLDSWLLHELAYKFCFSRDTVMQSGILKMVTHFKTLLSLRIFIYVSPPGCGSAMKMLCPLGQSRVMLFYFGVLDLKRCVTWTSSSLKYSENWLRIRDTTWRDMILKESREVNDQAPGIPSLRQFWVILIEGPDILGQHRWIIPNESVQIWFINRRNNCCCLKTPKLNVCKQWLICGLWDEILLSD